VNAARTASTAAAHPTTKIAWKPKVASPAASTLHAAAPGAPSEERPAVGHDPVVGWLVAYGGPLQGADFRIRCGFNSIGRDRSNHIYVGDADDKIHSKAHAFIDYEPDSNTYAIKPGEQIQHVYIRDESSYGELEAKWISVRNSRDLKPYDEIKIGGSKFVFVPLCGDAFKWELEV
jgi:hypothetical protein